MNKDINTLKILINISQFSLFTRRQRKPDNLSINHVNIIFIIYLLSSYKGNDSIKLRHIYNILEYLSFNKIKYYVSGLVGLGYVILYDGSLYKLSDKGIHLVQDIVNSYDSVFRSYIEKHKLNELF